MRTDSYKKNFQLYFRFWLIPLLMLATALVCLPFLPNVIPTHWDAGWNADGWGAKWWVLLFPVLTVAFFPILEFGIFGILGKYPFLFGSKAESDPKGFLHLCYLILSLACYVLEIFMIASGFYGSVFTLRFCITALAGAALVIFGVYAKRKKNIALLLELAGSLVITVNLIR